VRSPVETVFAQTSGGRPAGNDTAGRLWRPAVRCRNDLANGRSARRYL